MIFIRPIILHDNITSDYITHHRYQQIQSRQAEANVGKRGLIRDSNAKLPDIELLFTPMNSLKDTDDSSASEDDNSQQQ